MKTLSALLRCLFVGWICLVAFSLRAETNEAGSALSFAGNDYVRVPPSPVFNLSAVTMEMWFRWGHSGAPVEFLASRGIGSLEIHLGGIGDNAVRFLPTPGVFVDTPANAFLPGQWVHVACVYDPANAAGKIYLNGIEQSVIVTGSLTNAMAASPDALYLGMRADVSFLFAGEMDEVRIWDKARTGAEILADMNFALLGVEPGLVAYYHFDEGSGPTTISATTNVLTGNLINSVAWVTSTVNLTKRPGQLQTLPVISYVPGGATLRASALVAPRSSGWFDWGTSIRYGNVTPAQSLGSAAVISFSQLLTNLSTNLIYHCRAVVTNAAGTNYGSDQIIRQIYFAFNGTNALTNECSQGLPPSAATVRSTPLMLALGVAHCLALKADGTVAGWGDNSDGQASVPAGLNNVASIAAGSYFSLALKADGVVVGWGQNTYGNIPAGLSNVVSIAAGGNHTLAVKSGGTVAGWGLNQYGQINVPASLSNVVSIAAGASHSLALKSDGTVVAWGRNDSGQINVPAGMSNVVSIAAGYFHSLALKSDGTVVAWGRNNSGQINVPAGMSNVVALSARDQSGAVKVDGTVEVWGTFTMPVPAGLTNVIALAIGNNIIQALKGDGTITSWNEAGPNYGQNNPPALNVLSGPLGTSATVNTNLPGTYSLTYIFTNYLGAAGTSAPRTVVVTDTTGPVITLNETNPLTQVVGTAYVEPGATALDACAGDITASITIGGIVNTNSSGTYMRTYIATDPSGNTAIRQRTVVVIGGTTLGAPTATDLSLASESLNVAVDPAGHPTSVYFEYGTTTNYGNLSVTRVLLSNLSTIQVVAIVISNLAPNSTYFFRAMATNDISYAISAGASFASSQISYYPLGENDAGKLTGDGASAVTFDAAGPRNLAASPNAPVYSCAVSPAAMLATGSRLAMNFNGANQFLSGPVLSTATDNFCLEAWVKPASVRAGVFIIAHNGTYTANGWGLTCFGDQFQGLLGGITFFGSATFSPGTWTHVAFVRHQGTATLYVNGTSAGTTSVTPALPSGGFAIGRAPESSGNLFDGAIDQVRFFTFVPGQFTTNALLLNAGPVPLTPSSPLISSRSAATIDAISAQLSATINPNAGDTQVYFRYGLSTNYGNVTATNNVGSGICLVETTRLLTNLTLGSTYHYQPVAINSAGTNAAPDATFVFQQWMLSFDGADDYVSVSDSPAFNLSAVTIELWFKWGRSGTAVEFLASKGGELLEVHLGGVGPNAVRFIPTSGVFINTPNEAFVPGNWAHLACVYDPNPANNVALIYLNGVAQAVTTSGNLLSGIGSLPLPFVIGQRSGGSSPFLGQMDEVRVWNYARSASEIQARMNRSLTGNEPGLIAYYRFNEGIGTVTSSGTTNNLPGLLNNGVAWAPSTAPVEVPRARFTGISAQAGGAKLLQFQVPLGFTWTLESSFDLIQWDVRTTALAATNTQLNFTDVDATNHPSRRFYRLRNP